MTDGRKRRRFVDGVPEFEEAVLHTLNEATGQILQEYKLKSQRILVARALMHTISELKREIGDRPSILDGVKQRLQGTFFTDPTMMFDHFFMEDEALCKQSVVRLLLRVFSIPKDENMFCGGIADVIVYFLSTIPSDESILDNIVDYHKVWETGPGRDELQKKIFRSISQTEQWRKVQSQFEKALERDPGL